MTQPVNPNRVRKTLLLAALMLGPGAIALLQPASASIATCTAAIDRISVNKVYADPGEVIRVTVFVVDTNPLPNGDNNQQNTVSIRFTGTYAGGTTIWGASGTSAQGQLPETGASFAVDTPAIPADTALEGLGSITAELNNQNDINWCAETGITGEGQIGCCPSRTTGFWVTQKADLLVTAGSLSLIRHTTGDELPGNNAHSNPLSDGERVTRYPDVTSGINPCVEQIPPSPTGEGGNVSRAHFRFSVTNSGTADFTGTANGAPLPLTFRLRDGATVLGTQTVEVAIAKGASQVITLPGLNYSLLDRAGLRNVSIDVDSNRLYKETDDTNNLFLSPTDKAAAGAVYIKGPDLVPGLKDVVINAAGKAEGKMNMTNAGDAGAGIAPTSNTICRSRNGGPVFLRAYLDKVAPANELKNRSETMEPGVTTADEAFESPGRIGAGVHKVILIADAAFNETLPDLANEVDELNNRVEVNLTVEDLKAPVLSGITVPAESRTGQAFNITGFVTDDANFTLDGNNVFLDVVYPDNTNHTFAVPKTTLDNSTGTYSGFNVTDTVDKYIWQFHAGYPLPGAYSVRIRANDTIHEVVSQAFGFSLVDFSKAMELVSVEVCREVNNITGINEASCGRYNETGVPNQPANLSFLPESSGYNQVVRLRYKVPDGATGLPDEFKNATRKTVEIRDRDGRVLGNFTPTAVCFNNLTGNYQEGNACSGASRVCEGLNFTCWRNEFQLIVGHGRLLNSTVSNPQGQLCQGVEQQVSTDLTKPSQWNVTFWVGDVGCAFRGHTPDLQPKPAKFRFGLWDTVNATVNRTAPANGASVNARDPLVFRAFAADNLTVMRTFARVLRDGQQVMLEDLAATGDVNLSEGSTRNGTYQKSFSTGIYTPLDLDGEYQFLLGAQDANLTISWNSLNDTTCTPDYKDFGSCIPVPRTFRLQDRVRPTLANEEAQLIDPLDGSIDDQTGGRDAFEVGQSFVLEADVTDDTRITVTAEVQSEAGVRLFDRNMSHVGPATSPVYRSDNVTTGPGKDLPEGNYRFIIHVRDSAGNLVDSNVRAFRVAGNLPPTFSQRAPVDRGFGPPNGTVGVDISDTQGVVTSSVTARFGINTEAATTPVTNPVVVVREKGPLPLEPALVVRASFQLPASVRHGDKVVVSVGATDGSPTPQNSTTTWTFTVDGLAPRSTLSCTRSHPATCGSEGPQSVRGDTSFTLAAQDVDPENKARSGVASVRYALDVAGTPGTLQVVPGDNATFRLGTLATQDSFYTLRFRAVDAAGNEEPERRLVFALDSQGPTIQNVVLTPTSAGWNLTSTISDAASDVRSARLLYRAGATEFREVPLGKLPDTTFWSGNLPGARRGEQVCYYLEATDFLDNVASNGTAAAPVCFASENHPPQLTVTSPREGDNVVGSLTVIWQVSDIDNDPTTVTVAYRRSGDVVFTPVPVTTEELGQRRKLVDTASLVAGNYAVRVEAADNQPFNNRTTRLVNVTIGGDANTTLVPRLDKTTVAPGEPVKVRVELARAANSVEAVLLRGDVVVQTKEMEQNPPGSRFWEAEFRITEPGLYQVEVRGEYENGEPFVIRAASALRVTDGGLALVDVAVMSVLAVAVVAMAGLGLRRRGWL